jgi:hypothetical protein
VLRLFTIAVVSLVSFFPLFWLLSWATRSDNVGAALALALGFLGMPFLIGRLWPGASPGSKCPEGKGLYPECLFVVTVSEAGIVNRRPDETVETIARDDLVEVAIETNASGPWGADVWWRLRSRNPESECVFPGGATGEPAVVAWVQQLPNFDNSAFIQAMGSTSEARFVCWRADRRVDPG